MSQQHAVLCLRTGHLDGWYSGQVYDRIGMEVCLTYWQEQLGHSDLVIISKRAGDVAPIRLAINDLERPERTEARQTAAKFEQQTTDRVQRQR